MTRTTTWHAMHRLEINESMQNPDDDITEADMQRFMDIVRGAWGDKQ